jgi:hypothetical protein
LYSLINPCFINGKLLRPANESAIRHPSRSPVILMSGTASALLLKFFEHTAIVLISRYRQLAVSVHIFTTGA